jgi:heat shock protein HspQ
MSFKSGKHVASNNVRGKAQFANQNEVWDEVAKQNKKMKTETGTGTYQAIINSKDVSKKIEPLEAKLRKSLAENKKITGMVVAIDGKMVAVEVFYSPKIFAKMSDKLISSYVLEAVNSDNPVKETVSESDVKKSITLAEEAQVEEVVDGYKKGSKRIQSKKGSIKTINLEDDNESVHMYMFY